MQNLLDEMQYILESDKTIRELVAFEVDEATGVTYPSIAQEVIPEGMKDPYICIREESVAEAEPHIDEMIVSFDVVAERNARAVRMLANRIEQLFDMRKMMPYAIVSLRDGVYPIPTDDPSFAAKNVKIRVRFTREDTIEEDAVWHTNTAVVYVQVARKT